MLSKKIVVMYHNHCPDGFGAAWAAWKKFGSKAEYLGINHGEPTPKGLGGKELYFLDFCYKAELLMPIIDKAKKVTILDHHITQVDAIKLAHEWRYETDHSGAVISWMYFHPKKPIPRLLKHIEDYDLWKFKLPYTKEIGALLSTLPFDFKIRDKFARDLENASKKRDFIKQGEAILKFKNQILEASVASASLVHFADHKVLIANSFVMASEIGEALTLKHPPFGMVWSERKGIIVVSLRSRSDFDVSKIAKQFGGGGHKQAAGFQFPATQPFPWKRLSN